MGTQIFFKFGLRSVCQELQAGQLIVVRYGDCSIVKVFTDTRLARFSDLNLALGPPCNRDPNVIVQARCKDGRAIVCSKLC